MKNAKKNNLIHTLEQYFSPSAGQTPLVLLDAGTIIDLEIQYKKDRSIKNESILFLNRLQDLATIVIPKGILSEIESHHQNFRLNDRPEISGHVYGILLNSSQQSRHIIDSAEELYKQNPEVTTLVDTLRYRVREINQEVNRGRKSKKTHYDKISGNDLSLTDLAVKLAVQSSFLLHKRVEVEGDVPNVLEGTHRIAVLSSDSHIYKPINELMRCEEGIRYRDYLMAFNTREYIFEPSNQNG